MGPKKALTQPSKISADKPTGKAASAVKNSAKQTTAPSKKKPTKKKHQSLKRGDTETTTRETVWTTKDVAALTIQTLVRGWLSRREAARRRMERDDYEALMDRLEKEAFVKVVQRQQEEAARRFRRDQEERRRRQDAARRARRFLDAAFEGNNDELSLILKEVCEADDREGIGHDEIGKALRERHLFAVVECEDPNGNSPLSEAAGGGNVETIRFLVERSADPNSQGAFHRTPLYRAAFAGHLEAVEVLLSFGADPRIYADDGLTPEHVACTDAVREVLESWDLAHTDRMLEKLAIDREARREAERRRRDAEKNQLEEQIDGIQKEYNHWQRAVQKCTEELNKRIFEHDVAAEQGFDRPSITLQAVHDAEDELAAAQLRLEKTRDALQQARLQMRDKIHESAQSGEDEDLPGLKVMVRELDDVLFRDVGNKIRDSGKWPLIMDPSEQAATFLRYRDTNYINCLSPRDTEPDKIRMALLGALRFGKPFVIDMMEVDMFDAISGKFDQVQPGLMDSVMDRSILDEDKYEPLIRPSDGVEYEKNRFNDFFTTNFKFMIITKNPVPPGSLLERTFPIRVYIAT